MKLRMKSNNKAKKKKKFIREKLLLYTRRLVNVNIIYSLFDLVWVVVFFVARFRMVCDRKFDRIRVYKVNDEISIHRPPEPKNIYYILRHIHSHT